MSIEIKYTAEFIGLYGKLENDLQIEVKEKIELFKDHKNHTQSKVHKLHGRFNGYLSFSIDYKNRILFKYTAKNTATLLIVGDHDIYR